MGTGSPLPRSTSPDKSPSKMEQRLSVEGPDVAASPTKSSQFENIFSKFLNCHRL